MFINQLAEMVVVFEGILPLVANHIVLIRMEIVRNRYFIIAVELLRKHHFFPAYGLFCDRTLKPELYTLNDLLVGRYNNSESESLRRDARTANNEKQANQSAFES